jgi:polyisoprenoid-binding protein YceI
MTTTTLSTLTGDYTLDRERTRIGFVARHTIGPKVRGWFDTFEGTAHLDGDDPSRSSVELMVWPTSIRTGNARRDDQLPGTFFDPETHPTMTFVSTEVRQAGDTTFVVAGDLTIRGVTKPVTVSLELTAGADDAAVRFAGGVTIDRRDWGVNWNAATTLLVASKVSVELEITAVRRS